MAAASLLAVMLAGVSGAIAALGDTLFPASSLATSLARDFDPASSILIRLRILHPAIAAATGAWLLFYGLSTSRLSQARKLALWLMLLVVGQIAAGVVNLVLLAPVWMQLVHLLLADLLWIVLVLMCASIGERESLTAPSGSPVR
jgi:heme A synthase